MFSSLPLCFAINIRSFVLNSISELLISLIINLQVVMAVARVYHHLAPTDEVSIVARSLVRLLRSHRLDYILLV